MLTPEQILISAEQDSLTPAPRLNRQLYDSSVLSGSAIEQHHDENPNRLFNERRPNLVILHEKPEHRIIIYLKCQGLSNREIAQRLDKTDAWISQVLRQPWARERIVEELAGQGKDAIGEIIKAASVDSVYTLIEMRDNEFAKPSERISAANILLDRYLGKPLQKVETDNTNRTLPSSSVALEKELAHLKAEEKRLTGRVTEGEGDLMVGTV